MSEILLSQLGIICWHQDVIRSRGPGYRLNEWIEVKCAKDLPADQAIEDGEDDDVQVRRAQIIAEIRSGRSVRAPAMAKAIRCSLRTVKRDLDALKAEGAVLFDGPSKIGRYSVKG